MADGKILIDSEIKDKGIDKGLTNIQNKLQGAGKKMQSMGKSLTKGLTLPIVGAGTGALLMAKNFDDSMRKVKATMGDSLGKTTAEAESNFKMLREEAIKLGATTAFSASDAASAMEELALKGWDTGQIMAATGDILNLASASGMELGATANLVSGQMAAFGIEADKAGWATDMFQVTASSSGTEVEQLGNALEMAGGNAAAAGMDLIQTNAILGALANTNITGSKAGTTFNAMLSDLRSSAKDGVVDFGEFQVQLYDTNGEMKDMGTVLTEMEGEMKGMSTAQKDAAMQAVFGEQAQRGVNSIMAQGTDVVKDLEAAMKDGEGAAAAAAEEMEGGIGGAMRALASATESLAISFGDVLAPYVQKAAEFLADLALKFSNLSDGVKEAIVFVGGILAAIGPLLTVLGTMIVVITKAAAALSSINPIVLVVIGIIGALVAAGVALYQNWDSVKEKAVSVFSSFSPLLETVKQAFMTLVDSVGPIWESLINLWDSARPTLTAVAAVIGGVLAGALGVVISVVTATVSALGPLIDAFVNLGAFIFDTINFLVTLLTGDFTAAMEYWNEMTESAIAVFQGLWEGVVNFFSTFIETIVDFFHGLYMTLVGNSIIPDMVNAIVEWFDNMFGWLIDIVSSIVDGIINFFTSLYDAVMNIFNSVKDFITSVWNAIKDTIVAVVTAIVDQAKKNFNEMKNTISTILNAIKSVITTVWNAIKSVVTSVVSGISSVISSVFNAISSTISSVMNAVSSTISSIWNAISSTVSSVVNGIKDTVSSIFNSLKGIVSGAFDGVKDAVTSGINGALDIVTNIKDKFKEAGTNIVSSIAEGITGAAKKVTDAIGGVVSKARDFLPFSPAKEGPLKDLDKLNFGGPIEDSLKNAIPNVQAKMETLLQVPNINPVNEGPGNSTDSPRFKEANKITIEQNNYSPEPMTPSENKKKLLEASRQMALEWR